MSDEPLHPFPEASPLWAEVIDLADMRVQFGRPRYPTKICEHRKLIYDPKERRVWCQDCERTIDGFDAFMTLTRQFTEMVKAAQRLFRQAKEARDSHIGRIAAKKLDKAWSGNVMAVACPHCRGGLLPEDFEGGASVTSRDIEIARRGRAKERS